MSGNWQIELATGKRFAGRRHLERSRALLRRDGRFAAALVHYLVGNGQQIATLYVLGLIGQRRHHLVAQVQLDRVGIVTNLC